jgi:hypothetical protein
MGTLNALYIRASEPSVARAIRKAYPKATTEKRTNFFAVHLSIDEYRCPEAELEQLSKRLKTDVIWLSFQSAADAFEYRHWQNGKRVRVLVYGCFAREREWEWVEGKPQEWEDAVLFDLDRLDDMLEVYSPAERKKVKRIFREGKLAVGSAYPSLDSRETARGVSEYYRFPGWHLVDDDDDGDSDDDDEDDWDDE